MTDPEHSAVKTPSLVHVAAVDPLQDGYCPYFHHTVELLGRRWTAVVLAVLASGPRRFGSIRKIIPGLSDRLLCARLTELAEEDIVARTEVDGEVMYELTDRGNQLMPALSIIYKVSKSWGEDMAPVDQPGRIRSA